MNAQVGSDDDVGSSAARHGLRALVGPSVALAVILVALLSGWIVCPSRALLGVPCPGCGMTRATLALLRGELAASFEFHPLWPLALPLVGWVVGRGLLERAGVVSRAAPDPLRKIPAAGWVALVALLVAVWALRLAGYLGGHPDGVHPELGLIGHAASVLGVGGVR